MPKTLLIVLYLAVAMTAQAQKRAEIKLVVQADDIGFCHAANRACIDVYKNGIARSVEIIVPSPWFLEAAKMLRETPGYDVGVHLCLTSEWSTLKWRPLTEAKTLRDPDGYFCPFIWPNDNFQKNAGNFLLENEIDLAEVEKEFRAQIELAKKYIPQVSHLTAHMGCTHAKPEIKEIAKKLAAEYGLYYDGLNVKYGGSWSGNDKTADQKEEGFIDMLKKLQPGNTYHVVEHPGYDDEEMKNIMHKGYENVAADRAGVTKVWISEKVKKAIKDLNITLISVKEAYAAK